MYCLYIGLPKRKGFLHQYSVCVDQKDSDYIRSFFQEKELIELFIEGGALRVLLSKISVKSKWYLIKKEKTLVSNPATIIKMIDNLEKYIIRFDK